MTPAQFKSSPESGSVRRASTFAMVSMVIACLNVVVFVALTLCIFGGDALRHRLAHTSWEHFFFRLSDTGFIVLIYYALSLGWMVSLVGALLGMVALLRLEHKKRFALLALVCNGGLLVVNLVIDILLGLAYISLSALSPR
ncbi:MAG: hypothetical protein K1Y36_10955 [Blastocatellia bacterium]|nr:hypothetical protein [Blastocatellia bacterium]